MTDNIIKAGKQHGLSFKGRKSVPFLQEFETPIRSGFKTATTRNSRYGNPGEMTEAFDMTLLITHVVKVPLSVVAFHFYREEGFKSPNEFIKCWDKLHPRKGYSDNQQVFLHLFVRVK